MVETTMFSLVYFGHCKWNFSVGGLPRWVNWYWTSCHSWQLVENTKQTRL